MEHLNIANKKLKTAHDNIERDYKDQIDNLNKHEEGLLKRLGDLNQRKLEASEANGNADAADNDVMEINAGGKIITAKRSTLTQLKGTRLEAFFSGRWDKALQRDGHGRIFLDVNPVCFQAIVDYLHELMISSEDDPPVLPRVDEEHTSILHHHMVLFGLVAMPESNIIKKWCHVAQLHDWLKEDGLDGEFIPLYHSSTDGMSSEAFHSKCDNQGCTLTIIETNDGFLLGGYSNTPWSSGGGWVRADKAFLFVLSGSGISSPCKMKLQNPTSNNAIYQNKSRCPAFGQGLDLGVVGSTLYLKFGGTYESGPSQLVDNDGSYKTLQIKEIEAFEVTGNSSLEGIVTAKKEPVQPQIPQFEPVTRFSEDINEAINTKQESLLRVESEIHHLEDCFKDEYRFITAFASGNTEDVVALNVSGTMMAAKRSTLQTAKDSVLAQQFDNSKWTEQGCNVRRVKRWKPCDVCSWAQGIDDISDEVANIFVENKITGNELLALNMEGLKMIGIERAGTLCLLLEEIKTLKRASSDIVTLIEHSPYCFGKILDHLRLKQLHSQGLAEEPALPTVCNSQKKRFIKVVEYFFPGDSAKFMLG